MHNQENRSEIRSRIREARRRVSEATRSRWSASISRNICETALFRSRQRVAGFLAFDGEADPMGLMKQSCELGKQVFVPIIVGKGVPLKFAEWSPTVRMKKNRFGILEPNVDASKWIEAQDLDFVITPLVAFDESCNRIGVGGGYYDRSFAFLNEAPSTKSRVALVGFAFEMQKVKEIKIKRWDVPLSGVATESSYYTASS